MLGVALLRRAVGLADIDELRLFGVAVHPPDRVESATTHHHRRHDVDDSRLLALGFLCDNTNTLLDISPLIYNTRDNKSNVRNNNSG